MSLRLLLLLLVVLQLCLLSAVAGDDAIITRFQEYLRINTVQPNPDYYKAVDFINSQAKPLSLESQTIELVKGKPLLLLKWVGSDPTLPAFLLNSHTDVVPFEDSKWTHHPLQAHIDHHGHIYARGSQDMKCVGMQYLEAIRKLQASGFQPLRSVYLSFVPDEEIGGHDGAEKFVESQFFKSLNIAIVLDEGLPSPTESYRVFYGERSPWWLVIKAKGPPGHGAKLYDNSAMENLLKSIESIRRFRASQFDLLKAGGIAEGDVVSVNMAFLKAGTPSPTGFVMNLQPSEAEAGFDIRVPPNVDAEALERRLVEEWAPAARNMSFEFKQKLTGKQFLTAADDSNPWWGLLENAVKEAGGRTSKPEIFPASTDARYFRKAGVPAFGFSPISNTPSLLHDHNEYLGKAEYLKGIDVTTISPLSCSAEISSEIALAQSQPAPDFNPWSEFAQNVSGEWDGFGADFTCEGQPLELPESVVPEAFREWEVKVFDWQTQCPTLAQPHSLSFLYKSIKLLPTVGCEADAATRYSIDQRIIGGSKSSALAFSYSVTGSYVAVWPLRNNQLEVEHCLINPNDKESRVRIFQVVSLAETNMSLQSVKVFCEQWYGPFRDGDQLGGCAIRSSGFASTPTTAASVVTGSWRVLLATTSFHASDFGCIQQVTGEKVIEIVREEKDLLLLPQEMWCSLQEGKDRERVFSVGWVFEPGQAITSSCVFSSDCKLKEVTVGRETALSDSLC
ncbi:Peptidase M20 dimerization domain [Arabidopsis suecica]|uniref:N-acyl-aliphatic-L-amino acid amidohydrolase n=1 Tax=Arabidopsis suecica TaxID=45249 RepID=A0A8T1YE92_ARASU|nr:Peptidase M20 dimerization domain [Arabidopsis suecica]